MTSICLNMIVKDEAETILPLLKSVIRYIDYAVILDTGSQDNTQSVIKEFFQHHNMPYEMHERKWVDFATNRNQALDLARGKCDYILCLDADVTLRVLKEDALNNLTADCYLYAIHYQGHIHYNERLLKDGLDWVWIHPVHEQPESTQAKTFEILTGVEVHVRSVGGVKTDRYARDIKLLEKALVDDPEDEHALFYLGNSHLMINQPQKASAYYTRLLNIDTPTLKPNLRRERQYFALCKLAQYENNIQSKIQYLITAQNLMPHRAEALYPLLVLLREQDYIQEAYDLCKDFNHSVPKNGIALQPALYRWGVLSEYIVLAGALGYLEDALFACKILLKEPSLPESQRKIAQENLIRLHNALA